MTTVITLLLTVIIDIMGIGLVFPVLPELFSISNNHFLVSHSHLYQLFCITMMIVPFGWTVSGLFIGCLADQYGRKTLILYSLIMSTLSYLVSTYAISHHLLYLFLFSRLLVGISGGCFCLVQTVMCDIAPEGKLSQYLAWVNCASALGFVSGALVTSLSSWKSIAFDVTLPFWIGAIMSALNASMVMLFVKESSNHLTSGTNVSNSVFQAVRSLYLSDATRNLLISFFLIEVAWGIYLQASPMILSQYYHYSTNHIALFYLGYGLCAAATIMFIQPIFEKHFSYEFANPWLSWLVKASIFFTFIASSNFMNVFGMILSTCAEFLLFTGVLVMISQQSEDSSRGQTLGLVSTLMGASFLFSDWIIMLLESNLIKFNLLIVAVLLPGFYFLSTKTITKEITA